MPLLTALVDNFNDNTIGANWGNSYGGVSEAAGRARVPLLAGTYAGYQTGRAWTFAGASVYLKLVTLPAVGIGTDVSCNFLITSATDGTSIGFKYNAVTAKLRLQSNIAYFDGAAVELTYDPVAHLWLRLREDGTNVYWDTAPDGSTWTNRRTLATPTWVPTAVDTCALDLYGYRDAGVTDYAEYDNVNTLSDGTVYTATAALTGQTAVAAAAATAAVVAASLTGNSAIGVTAIASLRATAELAAESELGAEAGGTDNNDLDVKVRPPTGRWAVSRPWK